MALPESKTLMQNLEKEFGRKWVVENFDANAIRMTSRKDSQRYIYFRYGPDRITFADLSKTSRRLSVLLARRYGVRAFNEYNPDDPVFDYK